MKLISQILLQFDILYIVNGSIMENYSKFSYIILLKKCVHCSGTLKKEFDGCLSSVMRDGFKKYSEAEITEMICDKMKV